MKAKRIMSFVKSLLKNNLEYELYSYLWIQLTKEDAQKLEKEENLLEKIYH